MTAPLTVARRTLGAILSVSTLLLLIPACSTAMSRLPGFPDEPRELTSAEQRTQADWLSAVERYRDTALPAVSQSMFDVQVENGAYAAVCGAALRALPALAKPFTSAPHPELSEAATRVHLATRKQLRACVGRHPKRFNEAEARRAAAATELNVAYREWLGVDPQTYSNPRAW